MSEQNVAWFTLAVLLNTLDALTTKIGLNIGLEERNAIFNFFAEKGIAMNLLFTFKIVIIPVCLLLIWFAWNHAFKHNSLLLSELWKVYAIYSVVAVLVIFSNLRYIKEVV